MILCHAAKLCAALASWPMVVLPNGHWTLRIRSRDRVRIYPHNPSSITGRPADQADVISPRPLGIHYISEPARTACGSRRQVFDVIECSRDSHIGLPFHLGFSNPL